LQLNKYLKNVPIGCPAFLYQWDANNYIQEQIWLTPDDRWVLGQKEIFPGTIPWYGDASTTIWPPQ
jgi:peptide/nickel transport system substrate-binding protein